MFSYIRLPRFVYFSHTHADGFNEELRGSHSEAASTSHASFRVPCLTVTSQGSLCLDHKTKAYRSTYRNGNNGVLARSVHNLVN